MLSARSCAWKRGKAVQPHHKTVFWLCNFIVRSASTTGITHRTDILSAGLCATLPRYFPLQKSASNRYYGQVIPIFHIPNNKNYMDVLNIFIEKVWKRSRLA